MKNTSNMRLLKMNPIPLITLLLFAVIGYYNNILIGIGFTILTIVYLFYLFKKGNKISAAEEYELRMQEKLNR